MWMQQQIAVTKARIAYQRASLQNYYHKAPSRHIPWVNGKLKVFNKCSINLQFTCKNFTLQNITCKINLNLLSWERKGEMSQNNIARSKQLSLLLQYGCLCTSDQVQGHKISYRILFHTQDWLGLAFIFSTYSNKTSYMIGRPIVKFD